MTSDVCDSAPTVITPSSADEHVLVSDKHHSLVLGSTPEHVLAAQRLRATVFGSEAGYESTTFDGGRDADRFDDHCDHLLVVDNRTGDRVGCYRMLTPDGAERAGGYYTATEFDISELRAHELRTVEMGRACVLEGHRSGSVLALMWSGILRYIDLGGYDRVMGCVSVPMALGDGEPDGAHVKGVYDLVEKRHRSEVRAYPRTPVRVDGVALADMTAPARTSVPALMRGYLRMGASICGEPAHDPDFGVADFVTLLHMKDANVRYLDRLRSAAATAESHA
ncbi:GNAT family N-acetyltransferase [Rhodococcus sp. SORGH_AS_0303]|uniref:GNAT family N-acetyltransferase n=1 Tax=Rhodococcus sp. SORGH_AS_0303 TaxID=3041753 RepID=UPI00278A4431|nr:GNAT family N-acyltransferase [Rhodococcus sp. SORGH_AS_0303]MDQ1201273.1 putative hemolysin [Rhodococcus sp. SORGH_AS_0303]